MVALFNCALPDDGSTRLETCSSSGTLKHYCDYKKVWAFVGLYCNNKFCFYIAGLGTRLRSTIVIKNILSLFVSFEVLRAVA